MIGIAMYTTILTLHKQGTSQRGISRLTKTHRKTVREIIRKYEERGIEIPSKYERSSEVGNWDEEVIKLLSSDLSTVRIFEELRKDGFKCSYGSLSRYIRMHNVKKNTCIRFHSKPGEEGQVDFGDIGRRYDSNGKLRKAYVFNMRLSYSRMDYYEIVFDQKIETWINCHINAFRFFGGVPKVIKLDNLKSGIIDSNYYEPIFQKEYKRLSDHYGCLLSPCRPYKPQEKGKVESGIKYVKNNFFAGRSFEDNDSMKKQLESWIESANERIHGTTKSRPSELFQKEELSSLIELPLIKFDMSSWHIRKVSKDCHITLENNYYSVPSKYVSEKVIISLEVHLVKIYKEDELIATHPRSKGKGAFTTNDNHYDKYKKLCPGNPDHDKSCEEKMMKIGSNCASMLLYIRQEHKLDWYRAVKGIIKLRKIYDDKDIDKACLRGLHYGISSYSKIKKILENNCQNLPLDQSILAGGSYANVA